MDNVRTDLGAKMQTVTACLPTAAEGIQAWVDAHRSMLVDLIIVFGESDE